MEVWSARKKYEDNGYQAICEYTDPEADREPTLKEKKAVLIYSHLAVNCFCITIGVVALLLIGLLIAGDPKTLAVKGNCDRKYRTDDCHDTCLCDIQNYICKTSENV